MHVPELIILASGTRESGGKSWRGGAEVGQLRCCDLGQLHEKRKAVLGLCEENG